MLFSPIMHNPYNCSPSALLERVQRFHSPACSDAKRHLHSSLTVTTKMPCNFADLFPYVLTSAGVGLPCAATILHRHSSGCNVLWSLHCREDDADVQRFGSSADTSMWLLVFIERDFGRTAMESRYESDDTSTTLPLCENVCSGCSYRMCQVSSC